MDPVDRVNQLLRSGAALGEDVPVSAPLFEAKPILTLLEGGAAVEPVLRPRLDVEYLGQPAPGEVQRINLVVRVPSHLRQQHKPFFQGLGARWSALEQCFRLPAYMCYAIACEEQFMDMYKARQPGYALEMDMDMSDAYLEWRDLGIEQFSELRVPEDIRGAYDKLYSYQQDAVRWLVENPYDHPGVLLALSPGLGKTIVSLTAAGVLDLNRVLIIAPLSLLSVWRWEAAKWFGRRSDSKLPQTLHSVHGDKPPESGWVVTNYNTVVSAKYNAEYAEEFWDLIILDESVKIKNRRTNTFQAIKNLRSNADRLWLLSGSPITRHPNDLWAQFNAIEPRGFRSYNNFIRRFCSVETNIYAKNPQTGHAGLKVTGTSGRNLRRDFSDILFVRNQEQVLPDLPDMLFQDISVQMTHQQRRMYDQMVEQYISQLENGAEMGAASKLAQLIRLQQIASNLINLAGTDLAGAQKWPDASGKADMLEEMIEAEAVEYPLLVWTHWKPGAIALANRLENGDHTSEDEDGEARGLKIGRISGDMDEEERTKTFRRFKGSGNATEKSDIDVLILSLAVGKFGLTLTNTKTVVYFDKTWAADDYVQSLHRVRRIGLTHVPRVISLRCPGSIDDMVEDNLAGKMPSIAHVSNSDLVKMLKGLGKGMA